MSRKDESRLTDALPDLVNSVFDKVAGIAAISLAATFFYFLYALLLAGSVHSYPQLAYAERVKVKGNLEAAALIFTIAAILLLSYTVLRLWEEKRLAVWLALAGGAFYVAPPFLLAQILGPSYVNNHAVLIIQQAFLNAGQALLAAAIIRGIPALITQWQEGFSGYADGVIRPGKKPGSGLIHPLSPCWCLPYCRPYIRHKCARLQEHKTCWRKKSGCMCDDRIMAAALMGGEGTSAAARERLILEFLPGAGGKATAKRRLHCRDCFIFLEHQRVKHRYTAPLALPAIIAFFWLCRPQIESVYYSFGMWATHMVRQIALGQVNTTVLQESFANPVIEWMVIGCIGIYMLTYLLRFLEYVFFKLKI